MKAIASDEFLHSLAECNIAFDQRYSDADWITFRQPTNYSRFWVNPLEMSALTHFAGCLIDNLDDWESGFLWPRARRWPTSAQIQSYPDGVIDVVLRGTGVPDGWPGALRFRRRESGDLVSVMLVFMAFGGCGLDDLFFVPDHGQQILQTDHHDVVHVSCTLSERMMNFVSDMSAAGYELPTELPDATFKRPDWMD
jgi:hypothetical protein